MIIAPNSVDVTTYCKLVNPTTGVPVTGAVITDLDASYVRDRVAAVKSDLTALVAVDSAHSDNKAIEVDATNAPGLYRVDFPDAAFASGSARVQLIVNGAAIAPAVIEVELASWLAPITGATVQAQLADAVIHGGSTAQLQLKKATITATGNDTALAITGSGSGVGVDIRAGTTGPQALYLQAAGGHGIYIDAGHVGINLKGNSSDGGYSAVDIYNDGTTGDAVRIDSIGGGAGKALHIRGSGTGPAVEIHHYGTAEAVKLITADGDGLVITGVGTGHYDINADIHGSMDGVSADTWAYPSRVLTALPASTTDGTTAGAITRRRGDSWSISLTLGAITGYTSLWFTVKGDANDADSAAILMVKKNASGLSDGLLYVNGAAASDATKASITVNDATTGAITIAVDESITDDMVPAKYSYDVQMLNSSAITTPDSGTFTVTADVTKAIV